MLAHIQAAAYNTTSQVLFKVSMSEDNDFK